MLMNWLRRMAWTLENSMRRLMTGRCGADALSYAFAMLSLLLLFIGQLCRFTPLIWLALLLLVLCYLRMFSRNLSRRYQENARFLAWCGKIRRWFSARRAFLRECKTYRHCRCPGCRQKIRVPKGRGKIRITCPKCGREFIKKT